MGILRTILAIAVVLCHSDWNHRPVFTGGQASVQCFYIISGYLMSYVLLNNKGYASPLLFYANRAIRIYPVYLFVALISIPVSLLLSPEFRAVYHHAPPGAVALLVSSNLFLYGQDWVMFCGVHGGHLAFVRNFNASDVLLWKGLLVPQAWTLGVELTFYLLAPFIIRDGKKVAVLLMGSFVVRGCLLATGLGFSDPWTYRFFPAELGLFLLGACSQQFLAPVWERITSMHPRAPRIGTGIVVLLAISFYHLPGGGRYAYRLPGFLAATAVLLPLLFIFQNRVAADKWIGELSYPIYVGHMLVVQTLSALFQVIHLENNVIKAAINVVGSILLALILNQFVAKPFNALREKIRSGSLSRVEAAVEYANA